MSDTWILKFKKRRTLSQPFLFCSERCDYPGEGSGGKGGKAEKAGWQREVCCGRIYIDTKWSIGERYVMKDISTIKIIIPGTQNRLP